MSFGDGNAAGSLETKHLRPRAVVGYGVKIFLPSPPNYVTRSPGLHSILSNNIKLQGAQGDRGEAGEQGEAGLLVGESVVEDNKLLVIN